MPAGIWNCNLAVRLYITSKNARQLNHVVKQMIEASVHVTEEEDSDNKCQEENRER